MLLPLFDEFDVVAPFSLVGLEFGGSGEGLDGVVVVSECGLGLGEGVVVAGVFGFGLDGFAGKFECVVEAAFFEYVAHGEVVPGDGECGVGVECAEVPGFGLGVIFGEVGDDGEVKEEFGVGAGRVGEGLEGGAGALQAGVVGGGVSVGEGVPSRGEHEALAEFGVGDARGDLEEPFGGGGIVLDLGGGEADPCHTPLGGGLSGVVGVGGGGQARQEECGGLRGLCGGDECAGLLYERRGIAVASGLAGAVDVGAEGFEGLGAFAEADLCFRDEEIGAFGASKGAVTPVFGGAEGFHPLAGCGVGFGGEPGGFVFAGEVAHGLAGDFCGVVMTAHAAVKADELHFQGEEIGVALGELAELEGEALRVVLGGIRDDLQGVEGRVVASGHFDGRGDEGLGQGTVRDRAEDGVVFGQLGEDGLIGTGRGGFAEQAGGLCRSAAAR